jgi:hypothetical protein
MSLGICLDQIARGTVALTTNSVLPSVKELIADVYQQDGLRFP